MRDEIIENLNQPKKLEALYQKNKTLFREEFKNVYIYNKDNIVVQIWYERLNPSAKDFKLNIGEKQNLIKLGLLCLFISFFIKIPKIFGLNSDFFYQKNLGFILFSSFIIYLNFSKKNFQKAFIKFYGLIILFILYTNLIPNTYYRNSDTLFMATVFLPIILWLLWGWLFVYPENKNYNHWLDFLRFNGDILILNAILLIAGGLFSALTVNLFNLIGVKIEYFYFNYVIICGLICLPVWSYHLNLLNPNLVIKISIIVAKIFIPLVLLTLITFLITIFFTPKNPNNDRNFLILINATIIAVIALIFFSISENESTINKSKLYVLIGLSLITIIVNLVALIAILFRLFNNGLTPNRIVILGSNIIIFIHLILISYNLLKTCFRNSEDKNVKIIIAKYLPIYGIWAAIVYLILPILFQFR